MADARGSVAGCEWWLGKASCGQSAASRGLDGSMARCRDSAGQRGTSGFVDVRVRMQVARMWARGCNCAERGGGVCNRRVVGGAGRERAVGLKKFGGRRVCSVEQRTRGRQGGRAAGRRPRVQACGHVRTERRGEERFAVFRRSASRVCRERRRRSHRRRVGCGLRVAGVLVGSAGSAGVGGLSRALERGLPLVTRLVIHYTQWR